MVAEAAKGSWADVHQPVPGNYGCCCVPCLDVEHGPRPVKQGNFPTEILLEDTDGLHRPP